MQLTPKIYYHSEENYVFLLQLNHKHYFFLKVSNSEFESLIDTRSALMSEKSTIYWLNDIRGVKETTLKDLIDEDEWFTDERNKDNMYKLECLTAKVVD